MIFLLSSARSPRYRKDVLRALAAPVGTDLQFRYQTQYVPKAEIEFLGSLAYESAFVCHAVEHSGKWMLCPVRQAKISGVIQIGDTISVTFKVLGFVAEQYLPVEEFKPESAFDPAQGIPFFFKVVHNFDWTTSNSLEVWQKTIGVIVHSEDFKQEQTFFVTVGLLPAGAYQGQSAHIWPESLKSHTDYELLIFHYSPLAVPNTELGVSVGPHLRLYSPRELAVDSRYDLKRLFLVPEGEASAARRSWIGITHRDAFVLNTPVRVRSNKMRAIGLIVAVAAALTLSQAAKVISPDAAVQWLIAVAGTMT